jgi:mgtE-like transporter
MQNIIRESIWLLTICICIEILAGQILNSQDKFLNFQIILAAVPVVNGIGGNLGSILGARLTSGLHVGYLKPSYKDKTLLNNIFNIIILGVIVFSVITVLMVIFLPLSGMPLEMPVLKFIIITFSAGIIMTVLVIVLCVISAFQAFKRGMDPDNVVTPIVTTSGDLIGISIITILVMTILI